VQCRIIVYSGRKGEKSPRENPPNDDLFVFSHGDLSPRHTKVRDIPCVAFSATVCRIFARRVKRSPCENPTKSPFGAFSRGDLSRFRPENTLIRHGINQSTYRFPFFLNDNNFHMISKQIQVLNSVLVLKPLINTYTINAIIFVLYIKHNSTCFIPSEYTDLFKLFAL